MFGLGKRYVFILLLGTYSFLNIKFTEGDSLINAPLNDFWLFGAILLLVVLIWEGNHFLEHLLKDRFNGSIAKRLIRQFLLSVILVLLISLLGVGIQNIALSQSFELLSLKLFIGFTFRINLFLHSINAIIVYNKELNQSKLEAEQLKKETSEAQLESLRTQVNPHFLFNSFNVLSSVIENDPKLAVQFVEQLSKVYRYLLKTQDLKVVSLKEEMDFINSYIFLLKIRFQQNLEFKIDIEEREDTFVPPSTIQMLIENAIKHNEVSNRFPLTIELYQQNGSLLVRNNRNEKLRAEESSQVGLKNIKSRYLLLGGETPEVKDNKESFTVKIPLFKE